MLSGALADNETYPGSYDGNRLFHRIDGYGEASHWKKCLSGPVQQVSETCHTRSLWPLLTPPSQRPRPTPERDIGNLRNVNERLWFKLIHPGACEDRDNSAAT